MFIARLVYLNECVQVDFLSWRVRSLKFSEAAVLEFKEREGERRSWVGNATYLLIDASMLQIQPGHLLLQLLDLFISLHTHTHTQTIRPFQTVNVESSNKNISEAREYPEQRWRL